MRNQIKIKQNKGKILRRTIQVIYNEPVLDTNFTGAKTSRDTRTKYHERSIIYVLPRLVGDEDQTVKKALTEKFLRECSCSFNCTQ